MHTLPHYFVFESAHGFCGIAWSDAGITRFQLPAKSPEAAERMMLRRTPNGEPGVPPGVVGEAVAAALGGIAERFRSGAGSIGEETANLGNEAVKLGNDAWRRVARDAEHRPLARVTLPIWLYVSVTGVIVYVMLYRLGY